MILNLKNLKILDLSFLTIYGVFMETKPKLDFLEKYCKTKKISIEKYQPFLSLIKKLHDKHEASGEKSTMTFWRNVNNLTDMEHYSHSVVNITQSQ